jgi:putative transcriptional regulator
MLKYLTGQLLLASPKLDGGTFKRSVIYISHHHAKGAIGYILNQPLLEVFEDIISTDGIPEELHNAPVWQGGPVGDENLEFASMTTRDSLKVIFRPDISDYDAVEALHDGCLYAFLGHCAWSPGQLENEMARRIWIPCPADPRLLLQERDIGKLWADLLHSLGGIYEFVSGTPEHIGLN